MSTRIKRTISEWLENSPEVITSFDALLELSGTYNDETITIASANDIKTSLNQLWGERAFYVLFTTNETPTDVAILSRLAAMYSTWKAQQLPDYLRAFYALQLEYEPLDNYNGYEKKTITFGKVITRSGEDSDETEYGKVNDTNTSIYGYNSSTPENSDAVNSTDSGTDTVTHTIDNSDTESGDQTEELERRGNLGLTTSQQMITSEYKLRCKNFVLDVIKDFVDTYTCY